MVAVQLRDHDDGHGSDVQCDDQLYLEGCVEDREGNAKALCSDTGKDHQQVFCGGSEIERACIETGRPVACMED